MKFRCLPYGPGGPKIVVDPNDPGNIVNGRRAEYRAIFAFHPSINIFNNNLTIITEKFTGPNYSTPAATASVTQIGLLETIHLCKFCWIR